MRLKGKAAVVTGAGRGIGRAIAESFAREGARVVVSDVLVNEGRAVVEGIAVGGGDAVFVAADVGRPSDCRLSIGRYQTPCMTQRYSLHLSRFLTGHPSRQHLIQHQ